MSRCYLEVIDAHERQSFVFTILPTDRIKMQSSFIAIVLLQGCSGFAPHTTMTTSRPRTSRKSNFSLLREQRTAKNGLDSEGINVQDSILEPTSPDVYARNSSIASSDATVSIIEATLEPSNKSTTDKNNIFSSLVEDDARKIDSILSDRGVSSHEPTSSGSDIDIDSNSSVPRSIEEATTISGVVDLTRDEDVKAILVASGQAAVAAEASMSQELIEQLHFAQSNATLSASFDTVDALPDILTAASVVGEPTTISKIEPPKVSKILKFAIPAIGVWLCNPLLSLIDTSAVGLFSGTIQQAALNPAVAVTDYAALLIVSQVRFAIECISLLATSLIVLHHRFSPGVHVYWCNQFGCCGTRNRQRDCE